MSSARITGDRLKNEQPRNPILDDSTMKRLTTHTISTLRREAKQQRSRALAEARLVLQRAELPRDENSNATTLGAMTMRAAVDTTAAVVASLSVDAPIHVKVSRTEVASAFTNFESIHVTLPEHDFDKVNTPDELARLLSITKGLIYHEAGHIVFSLPFDELVEGAMQQGAVIPAEFKGRKGHALLALDSDEFEIYRWMHNAFEDQRMECALVRLSPVLESYLRVTVLYMLVAPAAREGRTSAYWPLLCGRTYLSKDLLTRMRRLAYTEAMAAGLAREFRVVEDAIRKYKRATTERELFEAVCQGVRGVRYWFTPHERRKMPRIDDHQGRERSEKVYQRRRLRDSATEDTTKPIEAGDFDDEGRTSPLAGHEPSNQGGTALDNRDSIKELVEETLSSEMNQTNDRGAVMRILREFGGTVSRRLPLDPTVREMTPEESARVLEVRAAMINVLAPLFTQADPHWQFRCEQGILDPLSYQLREPGDTDYWSEQCGDTYVGRSLALSLVLDVSYSMSEKMTELSVAAVGIRQACDELAIPCTVTTFADSVHMLFDPGEETREITIQAQGGTFPRSALEDLRYQHMDKSQHLVIVFTDGEWEGTPSMDQFRHQGMVAIGVALGEGCRRSVSDRHFDGVVVIERVEELPSVVTQSLSARVFSR